jgi:hypothetical protein
MLDNWHVQFPGCEPAAHELRMAFPSRWVRLLTPASAREGDHRAAALAWRNCILQEVFGSEGRVVLLTTEYSGAADPSSTRRVLQPFDPDATPWRRIPAHDLGACSMSVSYWHIFASEWTWRPGVLDPILRLAADDAVANVMVVDPGCRWLVHPYRDGMGMIVESSAARDRFTSTHADALG